MAAGSVRDPCVHKKTRFFCAQVTGEQPAFQGGKQHSLNDVAETQQNGHISHAEHEKGVRAFDLMGLKVRPSKSH